MSKLRRGADTEPETRVGICCGEHHLGNRDGLALFKVAGLFRYRCAECFTRETGAPHHMAPRAPPSRIVLP